MVLCVCARVLWIYWFAGREAFTILVFWQILLCIKRPPGEKSFAEIMFKLGQQTFHYFWLAILHILWTFGLWSHLCITPSSSPINANLIFTFPEHVLWWIILLVDWKEDACQSLHLINVPNIITACCLLHKKCEIHGDPANDLWLEDVYMSTQPEASYLGGRNECHNAKAIKDALVKYYTWNHVHVYCDSVFELGK